MTAEMNSTGSLFLKNFSQIECRTVYFMHVYFFSLFFDRILDKVVFFFIGERGKGNKLLPSSILKAQKWRTREKEHEIISNLIPIKTVDLLMELRHQRINLLLIRVKPPHLNHQLIMLVLDPLLDPLQYPLMLDMLSALNHTL